MPVFGISYDLSQPGRNYNALYEAIKSLGSWAHPVESLWFVDSVHDREVVHDHIRKQMDGNDKLVVFSLGNRWKSTLLQTEVTDWMSQHIG